MADSKDVKVEAVRSQRKLPENTYAPLVDIYETDQGTFLVAELPGVAKQDVAVEVDKGVLTISGQTTWQEPPQEYSRTFIGFSGGEFFRAFALSDEIDRERISASMADGVLSLKLPKAEHAKTRRIEVAQDE